MDLAGNVKRVNLELLFKKSTIQSPPFPTLQGPAVGPSHGVGGGSCHPPAVFHRIEKKLERDKRDLIRAIDISHQKLDTRLSYLEKKTKDQIFGLNQAMKESFAQERGECLDRMDRRALRERIAVERQQIVRDMALKRDLAAWLDAKLTDIEKRHQLVRV